jgi:excinuclease UvrABC nuclease subunit
MQLLKDQFLKKQKSKNYPGKNVIYMVTSEDNKKKQTYIIGKAKNLKTRLTGYNKSAEHEVIYYKECKSEKDMNLVEGMVGLRIENA